MESNDATSTLQLFGEIDLSNADDARVQVRSVLEQGKHLNINLEQVSYMDSTGVAVLIEAMQETQRLGLKLNLVEVSEEVMQVLELAHLQTILPIASKSTSTVKAQATDPSHATGEQDPFDALFSEDPFDSIFGDDAQNDNPTVTAKDDSSDFEAIFGESSEQHEHAINAENKDIDTSEENNPSAVPKIVSRNPFIG